MNCRSVQKFIYAFADGQLGVKANCEMLDHLKMCPACSRLVDEHQALRAAIGRHLAQVEMPAGLSGRIAGALRLNQPASSPASRASVTLAFRPAYRLLAAAACIALLIGGSWWGYGLSRRAKTTKTPPVVVETGQIAASLVAEIHTAHIAMGLQHQSPALPDSLSGLSASISRHFNDRLSAVVPDMTVYGYNFESASYCGVRNSTCTNGAHVIYASTEDETRLSFFVVPRLDRFDECNGQDTARPQTYREYEIQQASGPALAVLAWHRDETTYICCAPIDINKMKGMVGAVRTAMPDFDRRLIFAFAELRRVSDSPECTHTH